MTEAIPAILVLGPTAGGKTRLALELARRLHRGGECISADSMQVYRGMDIGTAKPTRAEQALVPHHMIDIVDPSAETFSVSGWLNLAERTMAAIRARGRHPVVVGGTNLYVKALVEGLFEGPPPDPDFRSRLNTKDLASLRSELERVDPAAAERIHCNDRKRTIRALEVHHSSGQMMSALQREWNRGRARDDVVIIGLEYPAQAINRRINARVREMFAGGLLDEARQLWRVGRLGVQAREALGYKQLIDHFEGRCSLDDAVEQIKIHTRRFAKQQRTWLRRFRAYPSARWLDVAGDDDDAVIERAMQAALDLISAGPRRECSQSRVDSAPGVGDDRA